MHWQKANSIGKCKGTVRASLYLRECCHNRWAIALNELNAGGDICNAHINHAGEGWLIAQWCKETLVLAQLLARSEDVAGIAGEIVKAFVATKVLFNPLPIILQPLPRSVTCIAVAQQVNKPKDSVLGANCLGIHYESKELANTCGVARARHGIGDILA